MLGIINHIKKTLNPIIINLLNSIEEKNNYCNFPMSNHAKNPCSLIYVNKNNLKIDENPLILASKISQDKITLIKHDTEHSRNHIKEKINNIFNEYSGNTSLINNKKTVSENEWKCEGGKLDG